MPTRVFTNAFTNAGPPEIPGILIFNSDTSWSELSNFHECPLYLVIAGTLRLAPQAISATVS